VPPPPTFFILESPLVVGLKLCLDCLSLSIALLHINMQPFERDRQELCVKQKNEVSCSYVAQKVKMLTDRKLWAEKCVGQDRNFQPMLIESQRKTKNCYFL